jgi:peptidoglycan/LPS O-acetylase OafA/YrhL
MLWTAALILIVTAPRTSILARGLRGVSLQSLGKYSYGLYVFQSPLIPLVAGSWSVSIVSDALGWNENAWLPAQLIYACGMFALTYATALLSWHLLERHCLKLKAFFPTQAAIRLPKPAAVVPAE